MPVLPLGAELPPGPPELSLGLGGVPEAPAVGAVPKIGDVGAVVEALPVALPEVTPEVAPVEEAGELVGPPLPSADVAPPPRSDT